MTIGHECVSVNACAFAISSPRSPASRRAYGSRNNASGRSDSRARLRYFFEVNRHFVTVAALKALADQGDVKPRQVAEAIKKYGIDPEKADPTTV